MYRVHMEHSIATECICCSTVCGAAAHRVLTSQQNTNVLKDWVNANYKAAVHLAFAQSLGILVFCCDVNLLLHHILFNSMLCILVVKTPLCWPEFHTLNCPLGLMLVTTVILLQLQNVLL